MRHVFGYATALTLYREHREEALSWPEELLSLAEADWHYTPAFVAATAEMFGADALPHIVVDSKGKKHYSDKMITHAWGTTYAEWPVRLLSEEFAVASPEFLFLQQAKLLDEPALAVLGCELCGSYSPASGEAVEPLTSVARIRAFLELYPEALAGRKALHALTLVHDGAASPAQAEVALRLCTPKLRGGFGIARPLLNAPVALGKEAAAAFGEQVTPAFFWPKHRFAFVRKGDDDTALALETEGVEAHVVPSDVTKSERDFARLAALAAKGTKKRVREPSERDLAVREAFTARVSEAAADPELLRG